MKIIVITLICVFASLRATYPIVKDMAAFENHELKNKEPTIFQVLKSDFSDGVLISAKSQVEIRIRVYYSDPKGENAVINADYLMRSTFLEIKFDQIAYRDSCFITINSDTEETQVISLQFSLMTKYSIIEGTFDAKMVLKLYYDNQSYFLIRIINPELRTLRLFNLKLGLHEKVIFNYSLFESLDSFKNYQSILKVNEDEDFPAKGFEIKIPDKFQSLESYYLVVKINKIHDKDPIFFDYFSGIIYLSEAVDFDDNMNNNKLALINIEANKPLELNFRQAADPYVVYFYIEDNYNPYPDLKINKITVAKVKKLNFGDSQELKVIIESEGSQNLFISYEKPYERSLNKYDSSEALIRNDRGIDSFEITKIPSKYLIFTQANTRIRKIQIYLSIIQDVYFPVHNNFQITALSYLSFDSTNYKPNYTCLRIKLERNIEKPLPIADFIGIGDDSNFPSIVSSETRIKNYYQNLIYKVQPSSKYYYFANVNKCAGILNSIEGSTTILNGKNTCSIIQKESPSQALVLGMYKFSQPFFESLTALDDKTIELLKNEDSDNIKGNKDDFDLQIIPSEDRVTFTVQASNFHLFRNFPGITTNYYIRIYTNTIDLTIPYVNRDDPLAQLQLIDGKSILTLKLKVIDFTLSIPYYISIIAQDTTTDSIKTYSIVSKEFGFDPSPPKPIPVPGPIEIPSFSLLTGYRIAAIVYFSIVILFVIIRIIYVYCKKNRSRRVESENLV